MGNPRSTAWLAALPVLLIFGPLLPGLYWALSPTFSLSVWLGLWQDAQWPQALRATLLSTLLGASAALALTVLITTLHYPGSRWLALQRRLPLLLSIPHAAFAIGLFFLIAPSGWIARATAQLMHWNSPPDWVTVQDPYGLSLALALALKESFFLLWVLLAALGEQALERQMVLARSLGYSRLQCWTKVLWPQVLPRLAWPLVAVLAYGLSVVDMALILGPGTPPTLAVLIWQWLRDPDAALQAQANAAALVLLLILLLLAAALRVLWAVWQHHPSYPKGQRYPAKNLNWHGLFGMVLSISYAVVAVLLVWSLAQEWFFPAVWPQSLSLQSWQQADWVTFWTTLWVGLASSLLCLPAVLVWLEWGPQRLNAVLYLPLILPALPLVAGQYAVLLHLHLDGTPAALVWSHLLWVLPYMMLTLIGAYRAFDNRLLITARALGCSHGRACLCVKWPILLRPLLATLAVGFAVSVAQYLPTLFAGAGRYATVTTEAVALSSGGNRRVLAVQALLQLALPVLAFALATGLPHWLSRKRQGLR